MECKLSVIFITYNHEKYVEKALMSVMSQQTDFPYEVIVGDDCSSDSTSDIVRRIAAKYPKPEVIEQNSKWIRLNIREVNSKRPTLNVYDTTMLCEGEYLAYLEGDDYWTDRHKLQKQVDFLDNHSEYVAVTHKMIMVDEHDEEITDPEILKIGELYDWSGLYTYADFCVSDRWPGHYASVVSRNIYKNDKFDYTILYRAHDFVDDAVLLLFLLMQGDIYRLDECMSVWRYVKKSGGSNWNSLAMKRNMQRENCYLTKTLMKWMEENKGLTDNGPKRCRDNFALALSMYIKKPNADNKKFLKDMYDYCITHVVLHDKKSTLIGYSIKTIADRLLSKLRS